MLRMDHGSQGYCFSGFRSSDMMGRLRMLRWFRGELRTEKSSASLEPWKDRFIVQSATRPKSAVYHP